MGSRWRSGPTRGCSRSASTSLRLTLFPGTGFPDETGGRDAVGTSVNVALPAGTGDTGWLRAFHAVVPPLLRAFQPEILVTQCGADTHRLDPLTDLRLSVDGQRAAYLALAELAEELCGGRWVATGGGGLRTGGGGTAGLDPPACGDHRRTTRPGDAHARRGGASWQAGVAQARRCRCASPRRLRSTTRHGRPIDPEMHPVDEAITATRRAVFSLHGLDPDAPYGPTATPARPGPRRRASGHP